jgi:transcriptional regulator with XRE-family HTH domain
MTDLSPHQVEPTDDGEHVDVIATVARNVKRVRMARRLSQAELARRSGVAKATLNQLEMARGNPTIETLFALAKVLRVPLGVLLHETAAAPTSVSRHDDRPLITGTAVDMSLVDSFSAGQALYELYLLHVRPVRQGAAAHASGVRERILVTSGTLRTGPTSDPVVLAAGDFVSFEADRPHAYEAIDQPATGTLLISYPLSAAPLPA